MGNPAEYKVSKSFLSDDFGYNIAVKWFGQEAVDGLPKVVFRIMLKTKMSKNGI